MSLPQDFQEYTRRLFGDGLYRRFLDSMDEEPPVSVRLNPFKKGKTLQGEAVPWCRDAYWLDRREGFTLDPLFHAGCYYVQEAGSMFLDRVLRQYATAPATMLDLCAAPGGKSTLSRAALPEGSLLFSNEPDRRRANILSENMQKQGHPDVIVTNSFAADYARSKMAFDIILTDVPCSGEGMFRKDSGAIEEWSIANVMKCRDLQRSIVSDIWPCLRPGGLLIYSTCTFNTKEDEENVRWIKEELGAEVLPVDVLPEWNITGSLLEGFTEPVYRFIPGVTRSEGLFMAVLRKGGDPSDGIHTSKSQQLKSLRVLYDGRHPEAGRDPKKNLPTQAEALSIGLSPDSFPRVELSLEEALSYLRHEALSLDSGTPRGIVAVCYEGHPIGFVKNIGSRANNLYPQEWKIRNK